MQKITTEQLEKELQEIDKRILIIPNRNRPGASNVMLNGVDICSWVPQFEVQYEKTPDYTYKVSDMPIPFKTVDEIKEIVRVVLKKTEDKEYADALFDTPQNIKEEEYGVHKV